MPHEISEEERKDILATENIEALDGRGRDIEGRAPIFLWVANALPISVWKYMRISLWIFLAGIAILEIYFLGQLANHYWNN